MSVPRIATCFAACSVAAASAAAAMVPAVGRYDARLCVSLSAAPPSCGAAEVDWQGRGRARVRVSDISYRLQLRSSQVEVVLTHGAMQLDEFVAPFAWTDDTLQFVDVAKNARYELRLGVRRADQP